MSSRKVVIIGHGYTSRLAVIRSVAQIGCEVTVIVMTQYKKDGKTLRGKKPIDCYSKFVSHVFFCHARDEDGLIHLLLEKCADKQKKVVIIPDSDFSAATIDKFQDRLTDYFLFPHIHHTPGAIAKWMEKPRQKVLAEEMGLNVSLGTVIHITDGYYIIPENIKFPCFTKPFITNIGGKQLFKKCDDERQLRHQLDYAATICQNMSVLIEDYKPIEKEYAVVGVSNGHDIIIPGIIQIICMAHGGHYGVTCRGKVMPTDGFEDLISKFKNIVSTIGFVGLFDIDFYQSNGTYYFCELNLRFGGSGYAITKMGVNLPGMMVKFFYGENTKDMQKSISSEATFVNERMCQDDWYERYITFKEYRGMMSSSDVSFIKDNSDFKPYMKFLLCHIPLITKKSIKRFYKNGRLTH